eukprot:CAMPEP_0177651218 /NCGR_PEP_ID=MMETSP0447-20121125/12412_1 /TAXON_ID=0 /ORGANISM="Stygamoeba regulata, Strain BSH-02190019" /LENGTH=139 /DNA_ID=CAMNT_0019154247 /DNA_START=22 /DNA_END=441 /DNA_ORIENTATION=+
MSFSRPVFHLSRRVFGTAAVRAYVHTAQFNRTLMSAPYRPCVFSPVSLHCRNYGGAPPAATNVEQRVMDVVKAWEKVDPSKVTATSHFKNDLGLDSLDTVELLLAIEDEFAVEIPDDDADKIFTVEDAIKYIQSNPHAK